MEENGMGAMAGGTSLNSEGTAAGRCTGNCMVCTMFQRQYCASQLAYSNMRMLEQMQKALESLRLECKTLGEKIEAMQNSEAALICPSALPAQGMDAQ